MNNIHSLAVQAREARLISLYLNYLLKNQGFRDEIEEFRFKYRIPGHNFQWAGGMQVQMYNLTVIYPEHWDPSYDDKRLVSTYNDVHTTIRKDFHREVETLAVKYGIPRFPAVLKEYILRWRFSDVLRVHSIRVGGDSWTISGSRDISKKEFLEIWKSIKKIEEDVRKVDPDHDCPAEVQKCYRSISSLKKTYSLADKYVWYLFRKNRWEKLSLLEEWRLRSIDKSQKSKLNKVAKNLQRLLEYAADPNGSRGL